MVISKLRLADCVRNRGTIYHIEYLSISVSIVIRIILLGIHHAFVSRTFAGSSSETSKGTEYVYVRMRGISQWKPSKSEALSAQEMQRLVYFFQGGKCSAWGNSVRAWRTWRAGSPDPGIDQPKYLS